MTDQKHSFQRHNSLVQGIDKKNSDKKQQFAEIYTDLCKKFKKESSKINFTPIIDMSKYRHQQSIKMKKITRNIQKNDSFQKVQIINFPQSLPKVRQATNDQKIKIKKGQFQAEKFLVNQTIYIHQKRRFQIAQKLQAFEPNSSGAFHSILGQKCKKLQNLSRRIILQNPQMQAIQRTKYCNTQLNKKIIKLDKDQAKIQFKKNKLIQTILEVQDRKAQHNQQIRRLQLSQKNILDYPLREQKITGNRKSILSQTSFLLQKKNKWKSVQKVYSIKQKWKLENSPLKKKVNWKITPFPLAKLQKLQASKVFRRYLGLNNISPLTLGFYKFYIGQGNNSQIIKQVLKSKGYWMQVDSLNQKPNFVWTQLPCQQFYSQQTKIKQYKILNKLIENKNSAQTNQKLLNQAQIQNFLKYHQCDYIKACQKILPSQTFNKVMIQIIRKFKKGQKINYYSDIQKYTKQYTTQKQIKQLLNHKPIKIKSQINQEEAQSYKATDLQLQNHVQKSHIIGNKKSLYKVFFQHCQKHNENINNYVPATIHYNFNDQLDFDIIQFEIQTQIPDGPWLIKPGEDTNRGSGIIVIQDIKSLIDEIKMRRQSFISKKKQNQGSKTVKEKSVIIQQYIEPFLYNNRKFDIRIWVLWAKNQLWWYREGYLRTSSKQFSLKSTSRYVHLTNDAVQITNEDYGKYEPANKLSYSQFQKYLQQYNINQSSTQKSKVDFKSIYNQTKQLTKKLFNIVKNQFQQDTFNFQLFGLDFVVGKDGKVWLIECNTNPSLQVHCSLQSRLISNLVDNMLTIVIDPLFPCPQKKLSKEYGSFWNQEQFKFQILIDGNQDLEQTKK